MIKIVKCFRLKFGVPLEETLHANHLPNQLVVSICNLNFGKIWKISLHFDNKYKLVLTLLAWTQNIEILAIFCAVFFTAQTSFTQVEPVMHIQTRKHPNLAWKRADVFNDEACADGTGDSSPAVVANYDWHYGVVAFSM